MLIAGVTRPIDDALVGNLRGAVLARDLVFEKVSDKTPASRTEGTRKEKAVYVVNTNRSPEARLVIDLVLKHR